VGYSGWGAYLARVMSASEEKAVLRRRMRTWRNGLRAEVRQAASAQVRERLLSLPELLAAQTVALYSALAGEIDVQSVAEWAWAVGKRVALPRVLGAGQMGFFLYAHGTRLAQNRLGVWEPAEAEAPVAFETLEAVVAPGLAFDAAGQRLGFGQGYYDRALIACPGAFRVGVAFDAQLVETVPHEAHDLPMHAVVTEQRVLRVG